MDINCPCMRVKRILQYITQRTKRESQDFTQYKFSWCLSSNAVGGSVRFPNCQQVACAAWPWDSLQKRPALWKFENHQMIFEKRPISQHSTLLLHLPIGSLHFLAAEVSLGPKQAHHQSTAPPVSCQIWSQRQLEECHQNQEYILQLIKIGFQFSSLSRPTPSVTRQILSERLEECRENQSAINHLLPLLAAAKDDTSAAWNV